DLRLQAAASAPRAARVVRQAEGNAAPHPDVARDELGRGGEGERPDVVPVLVRRAARRGHAPRRRVASRAHEDLLRRAEHANHDLAIRQRLPPPRVPQRLEADDRLEMWKCGMWKCGNLT